MLIDYILLIFMIDNIIFVEDMLVDEIDVDWEDVLYLYDYIFNVLYKLLW